MNYQVKSSGIQFDFSSRNKMMLGSLKVSLPHTRVGSSSTSWFRVTNIYMPLTISSSYSGAPEFTRTVNGCSGTVTGSCEDIIEFNPTSLGKFTGTLTYTMTDAISSWTDTVLITGYGSTEDPNDPYPQLCADEEGGSIIQVNNQILGEDVSIVGTPFKLHYSSSYAQEYLAAHGTAKRLPFFNPEGMSVSVVHFYDSTLGRVFFGHGASGNFLSETTGSSTSVVSQDGSEVYIFDSSSGKHLETLNGLTGSTKYTFSYTTGNKLSKITDAYGNETTFNRNTSGDLTTIVAPFGQTTTVTLAANGMVSSVKNPKNETAQFDYKTGTELLETFTKPGGQTSTFTYDADGYLTKDLGPRGNFWELFKAVLTDERELEKRSNMGRSTWYYTWIDGNASSSWVLHPSGRITQSDENLEGGFAQYNDEGSVYTSTSPDPRFGNLRNFISDKTTDVNDNGNWVSSVTTFNKTVAPANSGFFGYSTLTESDTTSGRTTSRVFDKVTKKWTITSPEGIVRKVTIDANENITKTELIGASEEWTYTFDAFGRPYQTKLNNNVFETKTYNSNGYLHKVKNALNEEKTYSYDLAGRVTGIMFPDSRTVTFSYDANGNLTGVTPPSRPLHEFTFNLSDLMESYSPPSLSGLSVKDTSYTYNMDNQLTSIIRPDGQSASYSYGSDTGLLTKIDLSRGDFDYSYYTYSDLPSSITSPDNMKNNFAYYGRQLSMEEQVRTSDSFRFAKFQYGFDSDHRYVSRTLWGNSGTPVSTVNIVLNDDDKPTQVGDLDVTYDTVNGHLKKLQLGNVKADYYFDAFGKVYKYRASYYSGSAWSTIYFYELTRNDAGRITSKSEEIQGVTSIYDYNYDSAGRLVEVKKDGVVRSSFVYDGNGNRTGGSIDGNSFSATYDNQDRLLTFNSQVYSHNANGDVVHIQWSPTLSSSYNYDALGSLVSGVAKNGDTLEYKVDGNKRLVHTKINGTTGRRFFYENDYRVIAEISDAGAVTKEFVHLTSVNAPEYMSIGAAKYFFVKDHLGSPMLVVNANDGTILQRLEYDDFGKIVLDTFPGIQPYAFAGGIKDTSTGLIKFGARYYNPEVGRWTSKDPIRFNGGDTNLYGYVLNDPINFSDYSGYLPNGFCVLAFGAGGFGTGLLIGSGPASLVTAYYGIGVGLAFGLYVCPDFSKADEPKQCPLGK